MQSTSVPELSVKLTVMAVELMLRHSTPTCATWNCSHTLSEDIIWGQAALHSSVHNRTRTANDPIVIFNTSTCVLSRWSSFLAELTSCCEILWQVAISCFISAEEIASDCGWVGLIKLGMYSAIVVQCELYNIGDAKQLINTPTW